MYQEGHDFVAGALNFHGVAVDGLDTPVRVRAVFYFSMPHQLVGLEDGEGQHNDRQGEPCVWEGTCDGPVRQRNNILGLI